jgi:very-short-patch-repair endonuclease
LLNLVIEIDGTYHTHEELVVADQERRKILELHHLHFLRFTEIEIRKDMVNVVRTIENYIIDYEERYPEVKVSKKSPL